MQQYHNPDRGSKTRKSEHILSASATLLGICFVVLTSLKLLGGSRETIIDEIAATAILFFMSSCCCSFLSLRNSGRSSNTLENVADIIFMGGLILLSVTTILFAFNIID